MLTQPPSLYCPELMEDRRVKIHARRQLVFIAFALTVADREHGPTRAEGGQGTRIRGKIRCCRSISLSLTALGRLTGISLLIPRQSITPLS